MTLEELELDSLKTLWRSLSDEQKGLMLSDGDNPNNIHGMDGVVGYRKCRDVEDEHGSSTRNGKRYRTEYYDLPHMKHLLDQSLIVLHDPNAGNPGYNPWTYKLTARGNLLARVGWALITMENSKCQNI